MARARLIPAICIAAYLLAPAPAHAEYPVLDKASLAKLAEQLKQAKEDFKNQFEQLLTLKEQLGFLFEIKNFINETVDTIGEMASIVLPITNAERIAAQMRGNIACLFPDGMAWGIDFADLNLSICSLKSKYKKSFFLTEDEAKEMTFEEQDAKRQKAMRNRDAFLADTTLRSMSAADVQLRNASDLNKAADELRSSGESATTLQQRLAVSNRTAAEQLRATAAQNEILAQMLKLQAAMALKAGVPLNEVNGGDGEGKK